MGYIVLHQKSIINIRLLTGGSAWSLCLSEFWLL